MWLGRVGWGRVQPCRWHLWLETSECLPTDGYNKSQTKVEANPKAKPAPEMSSAWAGQAVSAGHALVIARVGLALGAGDRCPLPQNPGALSKLRVGQPRRGAAARPPSLAGAGVSAAAPFPRAATQPNDRFATNPTLLPSHFAAAERERRQECSPPSPLAHVR